MGVIFFLLLLLVLFFLYLNKAMCFANCGGFPCLESDKPVANKEKAKLDQSFGYDDESSSDSEDELILRYQASLHPQLPRQPSIMRRPPKSIGNGAAKSDDASAADSDQAAGSQEERGIEGEVLDDSQLPTDTAESLAISGDGSVAGPEEMGPSVGEVEVAFQYSGENRRMNITIIQCHNLPPKDKGGAGSYRLRLVLNPAKRQRAKTRIRDGDKPEFKELFRFSRIYPHELVSSSIRIRLYGAERMRKERLIGEGIVKFSALNVSKKQVIRLRLKPQSELGGDDTPYSSTSDLSQSESSSSLQSLQHGGGLPELLTGLTYNTTTGRLAVDIIKGSHFKQLAAGRAPDSYVKVAVMSSSGYEMSKSKSSVRRGQPNPTFKETFIFQIAQFQLNEVTLMFTVYNKKGIKRKNAIGWFSMGLSNTSEEELAHWNEMQSSNGQQVCRWHALLESKS
ncbi:putative synaptotagmin-14 isoform X4 [Apostichopus japonicus]|uniref:Putative synaptotagmin-14 isoform X4 n=1 Tax=Stichopus japonicus TaxID=307972 RepID=A0A2G8LPX1_STIJA|nr:putative synaptotagmin-14 isoform X4 [Apostichopus japonicus]